MSVGDLSNAGDIQHIASQVGGMGADHRLGVGAEQGRKVLVPDIALPVGPHKVQPHALILQSVQGPQHGVVLQIGGDGVILRR